MARRRRLQSQSNQSTNGKVTKVKADPKGWEHALRLAGGDAKRIVIESPTELLVLRPTR